VLERLLSKIESLTMEKVMKDALNDPEVLNLIVKLNKTQLSKGKDSEGFLLGTYAVLTEDIARNYRYYDVPKPITDKIAGQPYNFEWTGGFFNSIIAKEEGLSIVIEGGSVDLLAKFGDDILGLDTLNFKIVEELICEKAIKYIRVYLFS